MRCHISTELFDFIDAAGYVEVSGAISPYTFFVRQFLTFLNDDEKVLHWLQNRRIERTFLRAGFPIGPAANLGARPDQVDSQYIGNLEGPRSRFISTMPLVLDPDAQLLLPRDLTPTEIAKLLS